MARRHVDRLIHGARHLMAKRKGAVHLNGMLHHCSEESHGEPMPREWYQKNSPNSQYVLHYLHRLHSTAYGLGRLEEVLNGLKSEVGIFRSSVPKQRNEDGTADSC
ncbi:hypothetical protein GBA52_001093 [Prunus armeniaca]|nr:hypothetical protein GBA52_001093 [Prunus armeniaca]